MSDENKPVSLKHAAEEYGVSVLDLRAEAGRGNLKIYKIGKRYYTKPNDLKDMVERCHVELKARVSTLIPKEEDGLSETERVSVAQDALDLTLRELKRNLRNTSAKNTGRGNRVSH